MKQLKKHAIGYNTVSSKNGVINARGVKSKPNDIQIFGYTHEVGTGEKSPDNPYQLVSLDSGNVNLYSEDKITDIQVRNDGTTRKGFEIDASMFKSKCVVVHFNITTSSVSKIGISLKFLYKNGRYQSYNENGFINLPKSYKITEDVEKILIFSSGDSETNNYFYVYKNLMVLDSTIMPSEYITDEHSIILSNNTKTMRVPVPVALNSVEGVSDYVFKDSDGVWKLKQMCKTINSTEYINYLVKHNATATTGAFVYKIGNQNDISGNKTNIKTNMFTIVTTSINIDNIAKFFITTDSKWRIYIRYNQNQYTQFSDVDTLRAWLLENPFIIIYKAITPEEYVLSNYAQDLLNSFELQNQNRIFVEGNPDIKVSGYIQK